MFLFISWIFRQAGHVGSKAHFLFSVGGNPMFLYMCFLAILCICDRPREKGDIRTM